MNREDKIRLYKDILDKFETEEMRLYCEDMIAEQYDYIYSIPSSTSYKYHNATQCQPGGQILHILMACTIMNYLLGLEYLQEKWPNPKQRDCLRVAIALHDSMKCGDGTSQYTVHEHPKLAQRWIEQTVVEHDIEQKYKNYIGRLVASHSGQWCTSNRVNIILPKPENDEQFIIHLCDYLSSRSNIDMTYSDEILELLGQVNPVELPEISEYKITFGKKHNGEFILDVLKNDRSYLEWCFENIKKEPLQSILKEIL